LVQLAKAIRKLYLVCKSIFTSNSVAKSCASSRIDLSEGHEHRERCYNVKYSVDDNIVLDRRLNFFDTLASVDTDVVWRSWMVKIREVRGFAAMSRGSRIGCGLIDAKRPSGCSRISRKEYFPKLPTENLTV